MHFFPNRHRRLVALAAGLALGAPAAPEGGRQENLLPNGTFDDPQHPLAGWRHNYVADNNRWYKENHRSVSVLRESGGRGGVLCINVPNANIAINQGVKVDSLPVPFDPDTRYRLTLRGRTTGPDARILIEGYDWRPGIRPHPNPDFAALRKVYRQGAGRMCYFGDQRSGTFSGARRQWTHGQCTFPGEDLSALGRRHLRRVKFISIHVVAIGGGPGNLLLDDVVLAPAGPAGTSGTPPEGRQP